MSMQSNFRYNPTVPGNEAATNHSSVCSGKAIHWPTIEVLLVAVFHPVHRILQFLYFDSDVLSSSSVFAGSPEVMVNAADVATTAVPRLRSDLKNDRLSMLRRLFLLQRFAHCRNDLCSVWPFLASKFLDIGKIPIVEPHRAGFWDNTVNPVVF